MIGYLRRFTFLLISQTIFFIIIGCAGKELTINYDPKGGVPEGYTIKSPLNVAIIPYGDKRTGIDSKKKVADISAVVVDVYSSELLLKEDVSALVTKALRDQLNHIGLKAEVVSGITFDRSMLKTPLSAIPTDVDIIIGGEIKRFHLSVANRDKIEIELTTFITNRRDGRLLWSGTTIEEGDRFAGTTGNTRGSIERYISSSLTTVIKKILRESEPALVALTKPQSPAPDLPPSAPPIKTAPLPPLKKENEATSNGTLIVTSKPPGARFYINDIYYGKTPINIELRPGIYEITVRLRGFKDEKEKVAIRQGISTELDVFLENEK